MLNKRCKTHKVRMQRLQKLYDDIKDAQACTFNIGVIVTASQNEEKYDSEEVTKKLLKGKRLVCGSAACVFGHFPTAFPRHYKWWFESDGVDAGVKRSDGKRTHQYTEETMNFLGISNELANKLTCPFQYADNKSEGAAGSKEAMKRLKKIMKIYEKNPSYGEKSHV